MRGLFPDYIDTDATSSAVVPMDLRQFAERVHGNNSLPTVFVRLSFPIPLPPQNSSVVRSECVCVWLHSARQRPPADTTASDW